MPGIVRNTGQDVAGGKLIKGSLNVSANTKPVVRIGDDVAGHGRGRHAGPVMAEGSPNVFTNFIPTSRAGDIADCGHPASGSANVIVNDPGVAPPVYIPPAIQEAINFQTNNYQANPRAYDVESNDQVKRYFAGTPEQPSSDDAGNPIGVSLIDPTAAAAGDITPFLQQLLSEAETGIWDETGDRTPTSNANITAIWRELGFPQKGAWLSDQTAWCMGFINYVLKRTGYRFVQTARARDIRDRQKDYKSVQVPLDQGQPGDIALWSYSHVNFIYTGSGGKYTFVGGNQSNKAKNANNPTGGSITNSWPGGYRVPGNNSLVGIWRPIRS